MITGFAHACFVVKDLEASLEFYRDKLGLKPAFDFTDEHGKRYGVYVHVGGRSFIELFQGEVAAPAQHQSFSHCCLEVDDIEQTVADLRARGVEVGEISFGMDNSWQAWLADPDGNRFELHQYTPRSWQAPSLK